MGYSDIKELLKDAKDIATGANDLQLKSMLLDIQGAVYELQEENRDLRDEIKDLKNQKIADEDLVIDGAVYKRQSDGRLFCSKCWDDEKKLISIAETNIGYHCPKCKTYN